jgi:tRNA A37 threonylcarbamoyladenosine modification protein TsaB
LLVYVDETLSAWQVSVHDIRCLGVVMGAGKFTSTRLAVTFANTLAYALQIPVISLAKDFDREKAQAVADAAVAGTYITPVYSAAPHLYGDQTIN